MRKGGRYYVRDGELVSESKARPAKKRRTKSAPLPKPEPEPDSGSDITTEREDDLS